MDTNQNPSQNSPSAPSPTPTPPPTLPPAPASAPPKDDEKQNIGVGTPNIGVENDKDISESAHAPGEDFKLVDPKPQDKPEQPYQPSAESVPPDLPTIKAGGSSSDEIKPEDRKIEVDLNLQDPPKPTPETPFTPPTPSAPVNAPSPESSTNVPINIKRYDEKAESSPTPVAPPPQAPQIPPKTPTPPLKADSTIVSGGPPQVPQPPVKAPSKTSGALVGLTILALILGSTGGFFGYKYYDSRAKVTAETLESPTIAETPSTDVSLWKIYSSEQNNYSLKYPNGWFTSTIEPNAEEVIFASDKDSLTADEPTGFKVDIVTQESNGQTLKKWVDANAAASIEPKKPKEIMVSGETAYQQELTKNGPRVATYIERSNKIMIVIYSASAENFVDGADWYNELVNSIKLM